MSEPIARPVFFEGQVLAAADLNGVVGHARDESARDRRSLHTPGIATGLVLSGRERETAQGDKYQEVTLSAGVAIDRTGRQVVLAADERLDETLFDDLRVRVVNDPNAWYPVFLRGRDEQAPAPPMSSSCGTSGTARVTEGAEVTFGRPGQELDFDADVAPEPTDGPGDPNGSLVLVGFVQWHPQIPRFSNVALQNADGVRPRGAGVLADEVVSRSGSLALRSRAGANQAAVIVDGANGGEMRFGLQDAAGGVVPLLTVDAKGNVTATGKISGAVSAGSVQVQSGVITDGAVLPLPPGVAPELVADGTVTLHVHLTPRFPGGQPPAPAADWVAVPQECRLDGPDRRVLCLFRWFQLSAPGTFHDLPGICDYTVIASVPPNEEGQP
jgi:hypothetical protein